MELALTHIMTRSLSLHDLGSLRATCKAFATDLKAPLEDMWQGVMTTFQRIVKDRFFDDSYAKLIINFVMPTGPLKGKDMCMIFIKSSAVWCIHLHHTYQGQPISATVLLWTQSEEVFKNFFDSNDVLASVVLDYNIPEKSIFYADWKGWRLGTIRDVLSAVVAGSPTCTTAGEYTPEAQEAASRLEKVAAMLGTLNPSV